jgi:hypothetical protein
MCRPHIKRDLIYFRFTSKADMGGAATIVR